MVIVPQPPLGVKSPSPQESKEPYCEEGKENHPHTSLEDKGEYITPPFPLQPLDNPQFRDIILVTIIIMVICK